MEFKDRINPSEGYRKLVNELRKDQLEGIYSTKIDMMQFAGRDT